MCKYCNIVMRDPLSDDFSEDFFEIPLVLNDCKVGDITTFLGRGDDLVYIGTFIDIAMGHYADMKKINIKYCPFCGENLNVKKEATHD